jgi:hypothetical protein
VKLVALGEISQIHSKQRNVAIANEDLHNGNIYFRPGFLILHLSSQQSLIDLLRALWVGGLWVCEAVRVCLVCVGAALCVCNLCRNGWTKVE